MPNERSSMSKLKQLIELQSSNLSVRETARALGLSVGAVFKYQRALQSAGIGLAEAAASSEVELERRVFGVPELVAPSRFIAPDCAWIVSAPSRTPYNYGRGGVAVRTDCRERPSSASRR
jgi:hypothetical protein